MKSILGFEFLQKKSYSYGVINEVEEYRHHKTGMEFALIPAGSFMIGNYNGNIDEEPLHKMIISKLFLMSKTK